MMMTPSEERQGWNIEASDIARNTHNPIRSIVENLRLEPNPDKPFIALSIGDPTTFGNLPPPEEAISAVEESIKSQKYNGYAPSVGYFESRQAVAEYSSTADTIVDPKDVILCSGCSGSLDICITALANPGQNILVPRPGFSIYRTLAEGLNIHVKSYNLKPDTGWEVDLNHLEQQIDVNTAALIVNNPSNPCGSVFSRQHMLDILQVAKKKYVPIIADEIYEHMVFPGKTFISFRHLTDTVPILSCSGLTKRFLVPGWRMGWIIIHDKKGFFDKQVRHGLQCLSQRIIGSNTIIQGALKTILEKTPEKFFQSTINILESNAKLAYSMLNKIEGLYPVMPEGAMYIMIGIDMVQFPDFKTELQFVEELVKEESVFCLPGKCFDYPDYIRIVLSVPEEQLREACERIAEFCKRHNHKRKKYIYCHDITTNMYCPDDLTVS